jgi:hypothetical protein
MIIALGKLVFNNAKIVFSLFSSSPDKDSSRTISFCLSPFANNLKTPVQI